MGFEVGVISSPALFILGDLVAEPVEVVFILALALLGVVGAGLDIWAVCIEVVLASTLIAFAVLSVLLALVDVGAETALAVLDMESLQDVHGDPVEFSGLGFSAPEDSVLDGGVKDLVVHGCVAGGVYQLLRLLVNFVEPIPSFK